MLFALACLVAAAALAVRLTGPKRVPGGRRQEADAVAGRAAAAIGSLLVFHDARAVETVKDLVPAGRLVSVVVLNPAAFRPRLAGAGRR